ncbi:hypothetical protein BO94DRAFT_615569 [Aspergillus sclerotioniger CBS 115572]|uniref:Mid2 domain-containing protein n=1 Tax=Aspergillus sclerotioniger CBS 115572 TaxID=1450535 RepID=A0A317UTK4_9EURO|nr:hypothetical protein BO94DRAFT_615569 [Aspergillus sclerotioniger CBS 115572]PWY64791.1 hypothetical protein BO94DRAFT_615569 [Aspergillus sclerotioniger CBS 115572]
MKMKPPTTTTLSIILPLLPLTTATATGTGAKCYAPDGTLVPNTIYQPCISISGVHSMCCRLNAANPESCDPSGLCLSTAQSTSTGTTSTTYYREFCTDSSWNSTNCLSRDICSSRNGGNSNWSNQLTPCGNSLWCCGSTNACCSSGAAFKLNRTLIDFLDESASGSGSATASVSTVTVVPTGEGVSKGMEEMDGGLSHKAKIGVGVGVALGGLVLGLVGVGVGFFWGRKRNQGGEREGSVRLEKPKGVIGGGGAAGDGGDEDGNGSVSSKTPCLEVVRCG